MLLAGTTFTELDQAASFWFAPTDTWRGGAPPHLRPPTSSRQRCELPPVTAPASTRPTDLPSLLARTRKEATTRSSVSPLRSTQLSDRLRWRCRAGRC